ncbi:MAG: hypothetical protein R6U57_07935 [Anaerolineales bacterium]
MKRAHVYSIILFALMLVGATAVDEPPARLDVTVPDIVISQKGDADIVEIPGGDQLLIEQGRPQIPYYSVSQDYPPGYRVQNVRLLERSEPEKHPGLNLPVIILEDQPELPIEMLPGWYPEDDFTWQVWQNYDESATLQINLYPFRYKPESKDALFFKTYQFAIDYVQSEVKIQHLQAEVDDGGEVTVEGWIQNDGHPQDLFIDAVIKCYGSNALVDGLPIRHLSDFSGEGSFSMDWSGIADEPETLYVEVILTDLSGNVLAQHVAPLLNAPMEEEEAIQEITAEGPSPFITRNLVLALLALAGGAIVVALIFAGFVFFLTKKKKQG